MFLFLFISIFRFVSTFIFVCIFICICICIFICICICIFIFINTFMFIFILLVIIFRAIFIILHITGVGIPRRSNAEAVYYRLSETIVSDAMAIIYVCCKQGSTDVRLISSPSDMVYPTRKSNYHDHYYYYITISLQ